MGSCFLRRSVFHTLCYLFAAFLTVVDHVIGKSLDALEHDYFLVVRS